MPETETRARHAEQVPEWEEHRCAAEFTMRPDLALRCDLASGHPGNHCLSIVWGPDGYRGA